MLTYTTLVLKMQITHTRAHTHTRARTHTRTHRHSSTDQYECVLGLNYPLHSF